MSQPPRNPSEAMADVDHESVMPFWCPDCKRPLSQFLCSRCGSEFSVTQGIPNLLSQDQRFASALRISEAYDNIYNDHTNVWEDQGRPPEFISYFSELIAALATGSILEVGCGEGILLSSLTARRKAATDMSTRALLKTRQRTRADCAVAIAERLPFPDAMFDVVVSVGVMEHFIDDREATAEIFRVIRPGGHYVALIHTTMTVSQRARQKVREYLHPRPRPVALMKWMRKKVHRPIHQPIQIDYTRASGQMCMEEAGFAVERLITAADRPRPPLAGEHVVIYVSRKPNS
jgi:SAM-dependent methyltransferase